ncbi:averantin oxidoreductase [Trematosphaeria pertusa]|uniref:Averantin oxidoreductase n=1 Tax=Trematosphaeria pertusa TaxID=390896 RepID=A0A6A6HT92_9PLEO|nr:averantin oxidoreductase [Trematosphaeria pertusa]KAF2241119.1 averantin oxidoreductase [Trematosphaeria pertusa]
MALFSLTQEGGFQLWTLYIAFLIIYRRIFHPLAKFRGPFLNSVSEIPAGLALLRGRFAFENKLNHEEYGSVFRLGPNELTFNSAQAYQDIYGFRQGHQNMRKSPIHTGPVQVGSTTTVQYAVEDSDHGRQRRALSHAFSMQALMEQEPIVQDYVSKFVENFRRFAREGKEFNIGDWFCYFTFDTMGDLSFGDSFGCLEHGEYQEWVSYLFHTIKDGALIQGTRQQKRLKASNIEHRDFIWYILKQAEKFDLKHDEIIANSGLFIIAGSETTATALSGLMARLIWNPQCYAKLAQEIRSTFANEESITFNAIVNLPYLNACIEEVLRIHPPVPAGPPRVVPPGGDSIDGYWVPGGVTVSVGAWASSHNPLHFRDPDAFIPERWLDPAYDSDVKKATQAFSLGPRNCIGKNLAYMEMRIVLARMLWNFDVISTDGAPLWNPEGEMKYKKAFMVWEKSVVMVRMRDLRA